MTIIQIDGIPFDVDCEITRVAEVSASSISGQMLNGMLFYDIIGTYLQYDVRLKRPLYNRATYSALYEKLTEPVAAHTVILPYNNTTVTITAHVEPITDELLTLENGTYYWKNPRFTLTSIYPTKAQTEAEAIAYGLPPLPLNVAPTVGDTYTWGGDEWLLAASLPSANGVSF